MPGTSALHVSMLGHEGSSNADRLARCNAHVLRESAINIGVYFRQTSGDINGDAGSLVLWNFSESCHTRRVLQRSRKLSM
jgi:hypothetical protein